MANDRLAARQQIEKLVQFFDSNIYQLKSPSFNETQARQQLIDPFFESFGWDMHNRLMLPLFRQEVVPESRVKSNVGKEVREQEPLFPKKETLGKEYKEYTSILDYIAEDEYKASSKEAVKKPDYRFRIGGQTKFFVEAKKPSVDLAKSQSAIFQVKRYGFSGRVPLAILTDFEEFRTFDCTQRPLFEKPKLGVIHDFDITYKNYLDRFDLLYDTFSREAVAAGSLEVLTKKMMLKRTGDFALDREFLEDLSKWREELARDIAKHPKNRRILNDYTLNEAVQRILDRIVFIRVCEDREIEVENTLLAILRMWKERRGLSLYSLLNELFKQRRSLYNGLLFSQHQCEELEVGDEVLIKILENLNYPFSPYHFNEIGVEILGSIYEKFLGKTIHLTAKTTRIEEKPEVRKAGGVYYTPQYIVKYIVDNTLGKMLYEEDEKRSPLLVGEGQGEVPKQMAEPPVVPLQGGQFDRRTLKLSPKQVAKLKIIDIACGSGSFLLGAFQKLIDYHIEWYTTHPEDIKTENNVPDAYKDTGGNYHLSPRKKRDILVKNIYGVDIDRQAVEVTQMSLYLKVLEGENAETLNPQMTLALKEVYLPSLANNIKCGNSLIGTDFTSQGNLFDEDARRKVNPFDWELEFPEILGKGRNNGKPFEGNGHLPKVNPDPLRPSEGSRGFDVVIGNPPYIRSQFIDSTIKDYLIRKYEAASYQPDTFAFFIEHATRLLNEGGRLGYIIPNGILTNYYYERLRRYIIEHTAAEIIVNLKEGVFENAAVDTSIIVLRSTKKKKELRENMIAIGEVSASQYERVDTPQNRIKQSAIYNLSDCSFNSNLDTIGLEVAKKIKKDSKPLESFYDVKAGMKVRKDFVETKKRNNNYHKFLLGSSVKPFRLIWDGEWVHYNKILESKFTNQAFRDESIFLQSKKVLVRQVMGAERIYATIDNERYYCDQTVYVLVNKENEIREEYFLGVICSKVLGYFFQKMMSDRKDTFPKIKGVQIEQLPIRTIDFNNPAEKKMHDDLVSLVEKMLELNKQLQKAHFDSEKEPIERQIVATDKKIDDLVYKLYGLTEKEIAIVEGKSS